MDYLTSKFVVDGLPTFEVNLHPSKTFSHFCMVSGVTLTSVVNGSLLPSVVNGIFYTSLINGILITSAVHGACTLHKFRYCRTYHCDQ